jgi:hypothetical protein
MDTINMEVLTRPFDPAQIRQREGRGGKMLDYVEAHSVISRLNEAFNGAWSFEAVEYKTLEGEIVVKGRLTAQGITKEQFGSSEVHRTRGEDGQRGAPVSIGDDLKAAASDALKKCATLFGVGLHLYEKADRPAQRPPTQQPDRRPGPGQIRQGQPVSGNGRAVNGTYRR